jgi:hypothetical protein
VRQARQPAGLAPEALQGRGGPEALGPDDLEGHVPVEAPLAGPEHQTHAAAAQGLDQLVVAEGRARRQQGAGAVRGSRQRFDRPRPGLGVDGLQSLARADGHRDAAPALGEEGLGVDGLAIQHEVEVGVEQLLLGHGPRIAAGVHEDPTGGVTVAPPGPTPGRERGR